MARDPIYRSDRACAGVSQDVFFPSGQQARRIERAQLFCVGCPALAGCAAWAEPLVRESELTGCVVAGVYVPEYGRYPQRRTAAAERLAEIAATGVLAPAESEFGAGAGAGAA